MHIGVCTSVSTPHFDAHLLVYNDTSVFHRLLQSTAECPLLRHGIVTKPVCPCVVIHKLFWHTTSTNSGLSSAVANAGTCICNVGYICGSNLSLLLNQNINSFNNPYSVTWSKARAVFTKDAFSAIKAISTCWHTSLCVMQLC